MGLRAVIFDYGEVLSLPANPSAHRRLAEITCLPQDLFDRFYWAYRLDYDAGLLNRRTYWQRVAREAGVEFSPEQIEQLNQEDARMWMDINEPMLSWACQLKESSLLLGILSNMGDGVLGSMRENFAWLKNFDAQIWSCELGIVKPSPAIYLEAMRRLGVEPAEGLFIDNLEKNVAGARAVGLRAAVFTDMERLGGDLRQLGLDLPLPRSAARTPFRDRALTQPLQSRRFYDPFRNS